MTKQLGVTKIKNDNKKYSVIKRVEIDEDTYLDIYPNMKPTEVNEVISEFMDLVPLAVKNKIDINDKIFGLFLDAVTVNHFSKLNLSKKDPVKYIQNLLGLINLDNEGFRKILEAFPPDTWANLLTKYFEAMGTRATIISAVEKFDKDKTTIPENMLADKKEKIEQVIQEATESVKSDEKTEDMKLEAATDAPI
jgi:hypothetical protein